jgi:pilus assembly protein FimV
VREFKLKKWVAAGLIVSMPYAGVADAAGLGGMNVLSQLGQPFSAEIELVNVTKEELATLGVRLASPEAYRNANLQYNPALNGLRLTIDRRTDGRPFIRAISSRPVAEPFLDLLVEVAWQSGRIVREYTALLDPPGLETPAAAVTAPVVQAAPARKAPAAAVPAPAAAPTAAPAPRSAPVAAAPAASSRPITGSEYAVKQGDTLGQIAAGMRPEGISLDQMMIGLLRANPDAFINNNINLVKAGKILKAPERDQLAAVSANDASQEVRVQASNWNAYRAKVADTAPTVADAAPATKGKITARVEDKVAAAGPKDVVVLSKGDSAPAKGKDGKSGADRVRALEEDLASRDKALVESNERIAILEKTIKDMQKLAELKNPTLAAAQQAGKGDTKADTKAPAKPEVKAEPPKAEAPKAEPAAADAVKPPPAPKAPAKAVVPPPPPPAPSIMDTVMENIVPIGGGVLLAGLAGLWAVRRKKGAEVVSDEPAVAKTEPFTGNVAGAAGVAAGAAAVAADALEDPIESNVAEGVDPIEEAQVYIDHGRDNQAEDILKEAIAKAPQRQDVQLKLLEVYAARGDKDAFNKLAKDFNALTGGAGESWNKAAAMGNAIDPSNALYPSTGEIIDIGAPDGVSAATVDLDIGAEDSPSTTTDILLDQGSDAPASAPDFPKVDLDVPPASVEEAPPAVDTSALDFNLDLPKLDDAPAAPATPAAKSADDGGLDFKVDFSGIDLNLDDKPAVGGGDKDAHWNDVQQKFDLARAYQEMGDKAGAKDILLEVVREGDAGQKSEAQKLLDSIK